MTPEEQQRGWHKKMLWPTVNKILCPLCGEDCLLDAYDAERARAEAAEAHAARLAELLGDLRDAAWMVIEEADLLDRGTYYGTFSEVSDTADGLLGNKDTAALLARHRAERAVIAADLAEVEAEEYVEAARFVRLPENARDEALAKLSAATERRYDAIANLRALTTPTPAPLVAAHEGEASDAE